MVGSGGIHLAPGTAGVFCVPVDWSIIFLCPHRKQLRRGPTKPSNHIGLLREDLSWGLEDQRLAFPWLYLPAFLHDATAVMLHFLKDK